LCSIKNRLRKRHNAAKAAEREEMEKYEAIAILSAFIGEREDYKEALRMGIAELSKTQKIKKESKWKK
jgi:hypothetical protein